MIPFEEGQTSELALTYLIRETQQLVRFRTSDMIVITSTEPCACGRTTPRFHVLGRSEDMIVVRGIDVYPNAFRGVVTSFTELSGGFVVRVRGPGPHDCPNNQAELADHDMLIRDLSERIEISIKQSIQVSARVKLLAPRSFARTSEKTQRLIREQ